MMFPWPPKNARCYETAVVDVYITFDKFIMPVGSLACQLIKRSGWNADWLFCFASLSFIHTTCIIGCSGIWHLYLL